MRYISIIGSTGSIGLQTLEVLDTLPDMRVEGLSTNVRIDLLEQQARKYKPEYVCVASPRRAAELKVKLADTGTRVLSGVEHLQTIATLPKSDTVVTAVVGIVGLKPTVSAICAGKRIALANKETLVTAGKYVMQLARERQVQIIPVDSEHSAVFQCLQSQLSLGDAEREAKKLILTASGGPFFGHKRAELENVTREEALRHPNWSMGAKITVDSATMMNKGLEVIEASRLFEMPVDDIDVVVHRQSVVHSMVQFADNAVVAQLGTPDMKLPIQYALTYPHRQPMSGNELDLVQYGSLTFESPDLETFGCLRLAYEAGRVGGSVPCVMNAANEVCVERFLRGQLGFLEIECVVADTMSRYRVVDKPSLDDILEMDRDVRERLKTDWSEHI